MTTLTKRPKETVDPMIALLIDKSIHSSAPTLILPDENNALHRYIVSTGSNGCRQVTYNGIIFMEQNKHKASEYATLAKKGHKITWGIRQSKPWIYILDGKIIKQ